MHPDLWESCGVIVPLQPPGSTQYLRGNHQPLSLLGSVLTILHCTLQGTSGESGGGGGGGGVGSMNDHEMR